MIQPRRIPSEAEMLHLLFGQPDDDCPVCRAHGLAGGSPPGGEEEDEDDDLDEADGPPPGERRMWFGVAPMAMEEILRCPCPLCTQIQP